ncbi:probable sodium/metabolite cotransporter BASS4, chloroplastic isoform X2 [Coffea eugenioides]|uniref:probable sodium/metabolite cotransporter BASS4, chloroplastic isoform X2 n=1 Tax=Coffea eugenioides TaxID=49369 RepID=UPI000F608FEC|nr:probable sodium/metabolite cotransporter BASS4, chloroplastic isoform X2 [Coffea eugenioides]
MAGTLQTLSLKSPAITSPPGHRRRVQSPITSFSPSGSRSLSGGGNSCDVHFIHLPISSKSIRASSSSLSHQGDGSKEQLPQVKAGNWTKSLLKFASNNFLPLALIGGVALGLANPTPGCIADRLYLSRFSSFGIFVISGLTLRSDEIGAAAEAWQVGLFGLASILFFTPFFSKVILLLKLQPQEFVTGLAIFCCMPTTLSSGIALTRLAGGNSALALAMTVISNLLGILIIPFSISKFIASGVGVSVPTEQLFRSLILTLLVPLILGKVPWIQVSRSRTLLLMVKPAVFFLAVWMGVLLHALLLVFNGLAIHILSTICGGSKSAFAKKENTSALLLVASQKTLPVMVAVVEQLGGAFGESGLLVLPCVAAHLNQIVVDSFLVSFWLQKEHAFDSAKAA